MTFFCWKSWSKSKVQSESPDWQLSANDLMAAPSSSPMRGAEVASNTAATRTESPMGRPAVSPRPNPRRTLVPTTASEVPVVPE